jgi:hypothetical protein
MWGRHKHKRTLRRYVLDALKEKARQSVELRLITEPEMFEAVNSAEQEVIEQYLDEALPAAERDSFERHFFTTTDLRNRVQFARLLRDRASDVPAPQEEQQGWSPLAFVRARPVWVTASVVVVVAVTASAIWLGTDRRRLQRELRAVHVERLQDREEIRQRTSEIEQLQARVRSTVDQRVSAPVPVFALATGLVRGEGSLTRIAIPAGAQVVQLRVALPSGQHRSYHAALYDADGGVLWTQSRLTAVPGERESAIVTITLPVQVLPPGDYQLNVGAGASKQNLQGVASYSFRVIPQ